jgi:uncharacterized protein YbjQ (UPF0145 family)
MLTEEPPRQPYALAKPREMSATMVTTANDLPGFRVVQQLGVVRGIVVRSRSVFGQIGAGLQMLFGGNITLYSQLCEQAREEAFHVMVAHAAKLGANAIVAMRYDATEVAQGATEVLCYGTAVVVQPRGEDPYRA